MPSTSLVSHWARANSAVWGLALPLEAGVGQAGVDEVVQLVEIRFHHHPQAFSFAALVGFGEHFQGEAQAGDGGAQFVEMPLDSSRWVAISCWMRSATRFRVSARERTTGCGPPGTGVEIAVAQVPGGLAQGFQISPHGADPEPQGDGEDGGR